MTPRQALAVIKASKNAQESERNKWDKFHDWYLSETDKSQRWVDGYNLPAGDDELSLETNYPYAWIDTMIASICPTNPQITVSARNPDVLEMAKMRERLANDTMRSAQLYKRGWRAAGHAAMAGYGITKTIWKIGKRRPITEVVHPRRFIWDRSVEEWDDVTFVGEATVVRRDIFEARAQKRRLPGNLEAPPTYNAKVAKQAQFGGWPNWLRKSGDQDRSMMRDAAKDVFEWVVVWEFYDFVGQNYWHFLEEVDDPLFEGELPYRWVRNPYDIITFNDNLQDTTGISDVHLIANLQERLNEIDTLELWHALGSMPLTYLNEGALGNPEAAKDAIQNATGPNAIISLELKQNRSVRDVVGHSQTPSLTPSWDKMREVVTRNIEFTLGFPQFMRGGMGQADIATEAALADAGLRTRNGRRVKVMEQWQASVAKKYIALWAENMDKSEPIPILEQNTDQAEVFDFDDFGFDEPETFDNEWWFEYESAPYSPTENHALIQLQKLQQFMPILGASQWVDNEKLTTKLLELLRMSELKSDGSSAPMPVAGQPGQPGESGMRGNISGIPPELAQQIQAFQENAQPFVPGVDEPPVEGV